VGISRTELAIGDSIRELEAAATVIGADGLERLIHELGEIEHIRDLKLSALTDDRKLSFAGGVAILAEVFEQLGIESMKVADGAMREGLLYDLVGRYTDEDARERTVRGMQERYHADTKQADRVDNTAVNFLEQVEEAWSLTDPATELLLRWAARLHEIGLDVAHSGYHRHGAYLLANADMAGFPRDEQKLLSIMVGSHRRKPAIEEKDELTPPWDKRAPAMTRLLRLAVLLHRGRSTVALPDIRLTPRADSLEMRFPAGWLDDHPLTVADLQNEIENLKLVQFRLRVFSAR
jgi:exopolyphosphatase/guanosine-5'-triphosphate,3'-diphosphate pyrophosphatase